MYSLVKQDNGVRNAYSLCNSDFEIEPEKLPIPFWINTEDVIYNLTPLIIYKEYRDEFEKILKFLYRRQKSLQKRQHNLSITILGTVSIHFQYRALASP